jgi:hypothetical protein
MDLLRRPSNLDPEQNEFATSASDQQIKMQCSASYLLEPSVSPERL